MCVHLRLSNKKGDAERTDKKKMEAMEEEITRCLEMKRERYEERGCVM